MELCDLYLQARDWIWPLLTFTIGNIRRATLQSIHHANLVWWSLTRSQSGTSFRWVVAMSLDRPQPQLIWVNTTIWCRNTNRPDRISSGHLLDPWRLNQFTVAYVYLKSCILKRPRSRGIPTMYDVYMDLLVLRPRVHSMFGILMQMK
jgi:hypothetical protein